MKRSSYALTFVCLLLAGSVFVSAGDAAEPEKGMIVGEVVDIATFAMKGLTGEEGAEAGRFRAEKGFPVGIVEEETGELFVAVYRQPAPAAPLETANEALAPLMGKKVVVQGMIYRAEGVNLVQISLVSEY